MKIKACLVTALAIFSTTSTFSWHVGESCESENLKMFRLVDTVEYSAPYAILDKDSSKTSTEVWNDEENSIVAFYYDFDERFTNGYAGSFKKDLLINEVKTKVLKEEKEKCQTGDVAALRKVTSEKVIRVDFVSNRTMSDLGLVNGQEISLKCETVSDYFCE